MEKQKQLTFFDVCSGIVGGRLGLEMASLKCIGHSEIDPIPDFTYNLFFGKEDNYGDLMEINTSLLPDFDFLNGICSSFSMPIFVLFHHRTHRAAYVATTYFFFDRF